MGLLRLGSPLQISGDNRKSEAVPQIVFSTELRSSVKLRALRRVQRKRVVWISTELVFLAVLLALLIFYSLRLSKKNGNRYAKWSSSWVIILLSVLSVVVAYALFATYYYYGMRLEWIKDPETSDDVVLNPQAHDAGGFGWRVICFRRQNQSRRQRRQWKQKHQPPWLQTQGRNSRAWREMRARQRDASLTGPVAAGSGAKALHPPRFSSRRGPAHYPPL
ncbi:hypothetical protein COEREDRAFT_83530 [Coemansia reversa NRRL 1564]|uniref:Uncharacterized protein n=1 Tax=Coemansia reversa (strain ATCC 12441 / NRRL 1564) TaxID=763665 RepID=A0A2G5B326_COERN|nr:hypothetical protein COEREDRAFT_83530 [Coemansia reversa NRRL 1564]|eukprot:PIA13422.1 hypothetical protein COEREDRAFT_83530 [Coemansia reversa NRRL 1564]